VTGFDPIATVLEAVGLLKQLDAESLVRLFWYTVLFDLPRYAVGSLIVLTTPLTRGLLAPRDEGHESSFEKLLTFSVVIAGHNEAKALRRCVAAIREQTIMGDGRGEIIVIDDGSSDDTARVMADLRRQGAVDVALALGLRGGKSAAVYLGLRHCTRDVVIIVDVDTSFDRDAFERLLEPFANPEIGAVCGNLRLRNPLVSMVTRFQAIEYLISISLGRRVSDVLGVLSIVSGAFGAFRREVLQAVGGYDVEVGEDADLTLKLIWAGWRIAFAPEARASTDAPETFEALLRQRLRWDRGVVTIWGRKYRRALDPHYNNFTIGMTLILADVFFFDALLGVAMITYLFWLFLTFGGFAWVLLVATMGVYVGLAVATLLAAAFVERDADALALLPYVPFYTLMNFAVMRLVRLAAFVDELVFRRSYRDPYVPRRVMDQVEWF
jgi:cellulose synthase/poly-beta-1,6-N-acetylglucosamine synthase-like glycosyltransferase